MVHAIIDLQNSLVAALNADVDLIALIGNNAVFDAPPKGKNAPYIVIARHDVLSRDGDETPGNAHQMIIHCWHDDASRKGLLAIVNRVVWVALNGNLSSSDLLITLMQHRRTDTMIDKETGNARAVIALRFFSEPAS